MDAVVPPTIISLAACGLFAFEEVSFGLRNQRSWDMLYIKLIKKRWSLGHEEWTKLDFVEGQTWVKRSPCTANSWVMWRQKESLCYIHDPWITTYIRDWPTKRIIIPRRENELGTRNKERWTGQNLRQEIHRGQRLKNNVAVTHLLSLFFLFLSFFTIKFSILHIYLLNLLWIQ